MRPRSWIVGFLSDEEWGGKIITHSTVNIYLWWSSTSQLEAIRNRQSYQPSTVSIVKIR